MSTDQFLRAVLARNAIRANHAHWLPEFATFSVIKPRDVYLMDLEFEESHVLSQAEGRAHWIDREAMRMWTNEHRN